MTNNDFNQETNNNNYRNKCNQLALHVNTYVNRIIREVSYYTEINEIELGDIMYEV